MHKRQTLRRSSGILCLAILCAAGMVYYHLCIFVPRTLAIRSAQGFGGGYSFGADFYPIWLTSREALRYHGDPYSSAVTRKIQIGLFGHALDASSPGAPTDYRTFAYPAFVDLLFLPLAELPFSVARVLVGLGLGTATVISIIFWLQALELAPGPRTIALISILTLSSYIVLEGLFAAQIGLLAGFFLAASLAALVSGRLFRSGTLLALALIKPQMVALVAIYLVLWSIYRSRERWRFLAGFFSISLALFTAAVLVWPSWIFEWLRVISGYRHYWTPPLTSYLLGDRVGPLLGPVLSGGLLIGAIALAVRMRGASPNRFSLTVCLLLTITVVALLPGQAVYDHVLLLPGIFLIALSWTRIAGYGQLFAMLLSVFAIVVFWQWISAPIIIALRPVISAKTFASVVMFPIRNAASIPFAELAILGLTMWREINDKKKADLV